jgi:hypothetical protein
MQHDGALQRVLGPREPDHLPAEDQLVAFVLQVGDPSPFDEVLIEGAVLVARPQSTSFEQRWVDAARLD